MNLVGAFQKLPPRKLYRVKLYYIDIINLGIMSDNSVVHKISNNFAIVITLL